ncbi:hypothetical protein JCM8097_005013 [Rhodosporidiobolus ruineniae]
MLLCFCVTSIPAAWAGTISTAMYSGGPVTMFFGFLIFWIGSLAGAASLGELCSMWPSAEGQIAWTSHLAPKSCQRFLRYYVACVAWIFMTCSAGFICSVAIAAVANFCDPTYVPAAWQICLIFWAIMAWAFCFNVFGFRLFTMLNNVSSVTLVCTCVTVVAVLLAMHKGEYNSAKFAFAEFVNGTGWENKGIVFILGMVGGAYSILGYDAVAHLCEELHEPERNAPKAMLGSVAMSLPTGLMFILSVLFTITDLEAISVAIFPFLEILYSATLHIRPGHLGLSLEGGIPFSTWFTHLSPRFNVPVRALAVSAVIQCLLVLIYIGNSALFNSFLQLAIALLNTSYAFPIALMLFRARPSGQLKPGPFSLGPVLGPIANSVALAYEVFISFFLFFPNVRPTTGSNMNYAIAIVAGAHCLGGVYWFCGGSKRVHRASHDRAASHAGDEETV